MTKTIMRLFTLAALLFAGSATFAQGKHHPDKAKADSIFAQVSERLKLTADQQTKLRETMKQNRTEMKAVREANKTAAKEDKRKAATEQMRKNDERISAILNDTQKAEYAKMKAEKKEAMKKKMEERKKHRQDSGSSDEPEEGLL